MAHITDAINKLILHETKTPSEFEVFSKSFVDIADNMERIAQQWKAGRMSVSVLHNKMPKAITQAETKLTQIKNWLKSQ